MLEINEVANMACRKVNAMVSQKLFRSFKATRSTYQGTPSVELLNPTSINNSACIKMYK